MATAELETAKVEEKETGPVSVAEDGTITFDRNALVGAIVKVGWKMAGKWSNEQLVEKLTSGAIRDVIAGENYEFDEPGFSEVLKAIQASNISGDKDAKGNAVETDTFAVIGSAPTKAKSNGEAPAEKKGKGRPKSTEPKAAKAEKPKGRPKKPEPEPEVLPDPIPIAEIGKPNPNATTRDLVFRPADALQCLLRNKSNRPFNMSRAKHYAHAMISGSWRVELPAQIAFDTNEQMQNGQKVCWALVEAGKVVPEIEIAITLTEGIPPDSADLLDTCQLRSHSDVLFRKHLFGALKASEEKKLAGTLASAAKIVWQRTELGAKVRSPKKFNHEDMLETLKDHKSLVDSVKFVAELDKETSKGLSSKANPAYFAAAHFFAKSTDDWDKADAFIKGIATGEVETGTPVFALREWMTKQPKQKTSDTLNALYDGLVVGWGYFVADKKPEGKAPFKVGKKDYPTMGGLDVKPAV